MNGLVLCLDAGNRKSYPGSGTTWTDLSGRGNNGTLTNMDGTNLNSANGGSLTFDGTNEYVSCGPSSNLSLGSGNFTINCWVYPTNTTSNTIVTSRVIKSLSNLYWTFGIDNTRLLFQSRTSGGTQYFALSNTSTVSTNNWYNTVAVRLNNVITVYVNGIAGPTTVNDGGNNLTEQYIGIGIFNFTGFENNFSGNISNFSVYNRALTASEIQQNYNALKGRFGLT
jgi:hypothetical protein